MKKNELEEILNFILNPFGFKKKGGSWIMKGMEITKMVYLQKSTYSNRFYINYGFIINSIPLDGLKAHVFFGIGSSNNIENERIKDLLNLENTIPESERSQSLTKILVENLVNKLSVVGSEEDLLQELKNQTDLTFLPLVVKNHFNLPH